MLQNRPVGPRLQVCGLQILYFQNKLILLLAAELRFPSLAARHALGACRVMTTVRSQSADPIVEHEGPSPCLQKPVTDPYLETSCIRNTALGLHTSTDIHFNAALPSTSPSLSYFLALPKDCRMCGIFRPPSSHHTKISWSRGSGLAPRVVHVALVQVSISHQGSPIFTRLSYRGWTTGPLSAAVPWRHSLVIDKEVGGGGS
jgi:hypothetical protein